MAATVLKRVKLKARPKVSQEIKQIARDAALILGYDDLAQRVLEPESLTVVLRRLDIEPFSWSTVAAYKEERAAAANKSRGYHY